MQSADVDAKRLLLYSQLYKSKKEEALEKIKETSPLLYWTKKYHLNTKGEELDFTDMYYLLALYKKWHNCPLISVIKSVQTGLSELFIADSHRLAALGLTIMYVLPKYEIRNRFVNNRITRLHKKSPHYAQLVHQATLEGGSHRTALAHFGRGGIAFVGSNVEDEFIEIPVDASFIDEYDRCNQKNILLVPDRLTASPYQFQREISNPTIEGFGIDERFMNGSQSEWFIKCTHCKQYTIPDFFKHAVMEISPNLFKPIDKNYNKDNPKSTQLICDHCHKPLDRLSNGEWVAKYPTREWESIRISQLTNKHVSPTKMITEWLGIGANKIKQQVFYNSRLGRAFSAAGSKILDWQLDNCRRPYKFPCNPNEQKGVRIMGMDVGATLHYVIRERVNDKGLEVTRLVSLGEARDFKEARKIIRDWKPKICVVDADPELHEIAELKEDCSCVYSSRFQRDLLEMTVNKEDRHIKMDRTSALDKVKENVDTQVSLIPMEGNQLHNEQYYVHMSAPTRLLEEEGEGGKQRFIWREGSRPDHFFLAETYCAQADAIIPYRSVFDYYKSEADRIDEKVAKDKDLKNMLGNKDVARLANLTPEIFSSTISKTYTPKESLREESVIDLEIKAVAEQQELTFGIVELRRFQLATGLNEAKAIAFLNSHDYSMVGGGYKKNESKA